jgi:hypothetical protein
MRYRGAVFALATMMLALPVSQTWAFDDAKYPNLKGQWIGVRPITGPGLQPSFDPYKRWGTTQDAPLTAEYKALFEANLEEQRVRGQGTNAPSTQDRSIKVDAVTYALTG